MKLLAPLSAMMGSALASQRLLASLIGEYTGNTELAQFVTARAVDLNGAEEKLPQLAQHVNHVWTVDCKDTRDFLYRNPVEQTIAQQLVGVGVSFEGRRLMCASFDDIRDICQNVIESATLFCTRDLCKRFAPAVNGRLKIGYHICTPFAGTAASLTQFDR